MKRISQPRPRLIDLIEGYYLTRVIDLLHREGVLQALVDGRNIDSIAGERGWKRQVLRQLLQYVALRSDLVDARGTKGKPRFRVSAAYTRSSLPAHLLDQYVGAYGPCLDKLERALRGADPGRLIDRKRHAAAFSRLDGSASHFEIARIVQELEITNLLDLGCAGADMLMDLAQRSPRFSGLGFDANAGMVRLAKKRVAKAGLTERLQIIHGNVFQLAKITSAAAREEIQGITAMSLANEFFGDEEKPDIGKFLAKLRRLFPRRILIVGDYFGCLGGEARNPASFQRSLLHDVAQFASGQGVPPCDRNKWRRIYKKASCTLIKEFEGVSDGVARFIHLVQL